MILIVTNKRDITSDLIVLELRARGVDFLRLNTEDLSSTQIRFHPDHGWEMDLSGNVLALRDVHAAYYRRPGTPGISSVFTDGATRDYLANEWAAVLRSLWNALEGRWLSSPFSILRAEDKPRQLALAYQLGFAVPETLVSNDFTAVSAFAHAGGVIGKPLRHALIERGPAGEVVFTSRLKPLISEDRQAVAIAPVIYQQEIRKRFDIRATVIGSKVYAVSIASQAFAESEVDWRSSSQLDLEHQSITIPQQLAERCVHLVGLLDLRYGAIDLVQDRSGKYWFLEINPNGQWGWIQIRTGLPLAAAIVDELLTIAAQ